MMFVAFSRKKNKRALPNAECSIVRKEEVGVSNPRLLSNTGSLCSTKPQCTDRDQ